MYQFDAFEDPRWDAKLSAALKERGMALAADARAADLSVARLIAQLHQNAREGIQMDDVNELREHFGIFKSLGNASGSLFRGAPELWRHTGKYRPSRKVSRHRGMQGVWAYIGN